MAQAETIRLALAACGIEADLLTCRTHGDRDRTSPLTSFGGTGAFVRAIEEALLAGKGDAAVHSLKDLPSMIPEHLRLSAVAERGAVGDILITRGGENLDGLTEGAVLGTSSPRRKAQILRARPDIKVANIRGNVTTRLKKLEEGNYDGIVVAKAGLDRLGIAPEHSSILPFIPAPCQGIIALETMDEALVTEKAIKINHRDTWLCAIAERVLLRRLGVGCHVPFAALATVESGEMHISAEILEDDGSDYSAFSVSNTADSEEEASELGEELAGMFLSDGKAIKLIKEVIL